MLHNVIYLDDRGEVERQHMGEMKRKKKKKKGREGKKGEKKKCRDVKERK
jgi:hypothetical protein